MARSYVIMLASAKHVASGGVGLVYLAAVLPGLLLKLSATFWFHRAPYALRAVAAAVIMAAAFTLVAEASRARSLTVRRQKHPFPGAQCIPDFGANTSGVGWREQGQLLGVALVSLQGGLGESTLLALSSRYTKCVAVRADRVEAEKSEVSCCRR